MLSMPLRVDNRIVSIAFLTFRVIAEWSGDDIWVNLGQRELKPMASGTLGTFSTADLAGSAPAYVCDIRLVAIKDLGTPQETWSLVDTQVFGFHREGN
jgi:hypothetical protein